MSASEESFQSCRFLQELKFDVRAKKVVSYAWQFLVA